MFVCAPREIARHAGIKNTVRLIGNEIYEAMSGGFVYFITNKPNGILYTGVTSNLPRRAYEHREGTIEGFSKRYGLKCPVYYERFDDIRDAIQREKTIKHWPRAW